MRLHLVEIHDLAWSPRSPRDALTDFLSFFANPGGAYDSVGPLLRAAIERTGARRIIDLCSGAGGPWSRLAPLVGLVVQMPELDGFRTIFTAFHHFRPAEARAILADAVARKQGIGVFEIARRAPREIAIIAFTWLGALAALPFMRPWRWSRFFWTYLPPALPVAGTFDGIVSCLRTYTHAELRALVEGLDSYTCDIGDFRGKWSPLRGTYLIGVPKPGLDR